mgnify:CR=1
YLGKDEDKIEIVIREDAKRLRTKLREEIEKNLEKRGSARKKKNTYKNRKKLQ